MNKLIKPYALQTGDTIASITNSNALAHCFPWRYQAGKKQLQDAFGVKVIETPNALKSSEELHMNPKLRADDLMWAFKNPDVKAIISIIGGEDCIRLLPWIDFDIIKNNPKIFMGFSDPTSIHLMCYKAGLSSIYGPSILAGFAENGGLMPYLKESVQKTLFQTNPIGEIKPNTDGWTIEVLDWSNPDTQHIKRTLNPHTGYEILQGTEIARGHLLGGCMEVLDMCRGTDVFPTLNQWKGAIMFLETSEEQPPVGMLRNLLESMQSTGALQQIKGIIMGRPKEGTEIGRHQYDATLLSILKEAGQEHIPVMTQMDFGHTEPQFCIPYGAMGEINPLLKTFSILESAVQKGI